jgi:hypothetical protein
MSSWTVQWNGHRCIMWPWLVCGQTYCNCHSSQVSCLDHDGGHGFSNSNTRDHSWRIGGCFGRFQRWIISKCNEQQARKPWVLSRTWCLTCIIVGWVLVTTENIKSHFHWFRLSKPILRYSHYDDFKRVYLCQVKQYVHWFLWKQHGREEDRKTG